MKSDQWPRDLKVIEVKIHISTIFYYIYFGI